MQSAKAESAPQMGDAASTAELLDVKTVSEILACSTRHVYRMADAGFMPRPVKLGQLVRWRRAELTRWLSQGCPRLKSLRQARS